MNAAASYASYERAGSHDLVGQHAGLVRKIALHLAARLPDSVELDDLIQSGMIGLLEAAASFDASQGASFETFAGIRIRGTISSPTARSSPLSSRTRTILPSAPGETDLKISHGPNSYSLQ